MALAGVVLYRSGSYRCRRIASFRQVNRGGSCEPLAGWVLMRNTRKGFWEGFIPSIHAARSWAARVGEFVPMPASAGGVVRKSFAGGTNGVAWGWDACNGETRTMMRTRRHPWVSNMREETREVRASSLYKPQKTGDSNRLKKPCNILSELVLLYFYPKIEIVGKTY